MSPQVARHAWSAAAHRRASLTRAEIFGDDEILMPKTELEDARTAVPGMVGFDYEAGGFLLLSINPAGGRDGAESRLSDRAMYSAFRTFAQSGALADFEHVNEIVGREMPTWTVYRQHTKPILDALTVKVRHIAYVNVVPFRTRGDQGAKIPSKYVYQSVDLGLHAQLVALSPKLIVALDRHSERVANLLRAQTKDPWHVVYYTRKRDAHADRRATLSILESWRRP